MTTGITAVRVHGGANAAGSARWDFSTCSNAAGPCPSALAAVSAADSTRYPDPTAARVRKALADWHGVAPHRILPAASASEFIQRITTVTSRLWPGGVSVPRYAYGDYAIAAQANNRCLTTFDSAQSSNATLLWCTDPSSPHGANGGLDANRTRWPFVLDRVYAPLRLTGSSEWSGAALDDVFTLHSPNKALGLTGVRGAYAIAPARAKYDLKTCCAALELSAPSWPWSAHAEAMLASWVTADVQAWLQQSLAALTSWKRQLRLGLDSRGFEVLPSVTPFFVVRPPQPFDLSRLRAHGVAVRDATSFGLPGRWRVAVQPPVACDALMQALDDVAECCR